MEDAKDILQEIVDMIDYDGAGPLVFAYVNGEMEQVHVSEDLAYLLMEARDLLEE